VSNNRPGKEALLDAGLQKALEQAGRRGLSFEQLVRAAGSEWEPHAVEAGLRRLMDAGIAIDWNRRWMAQELTDWRTGRVRVLADGDAEVVPLDTAPARRGASTRGAWRVRKSELKGARNGDRVIVKMGGGSRGRRGAERASVARILESGPRHIVGTLEIGERQGRWLVPFDSRLDLEVAVDGGDELLEDQYVVVELAPLKGKGTAGAARRGRVVEVLGDVEQPGVDVRVVLRHLEIPEEFPGDLLTSVSGLPADPEPAAWEGREDLRKLTTVTIDGETARDFDDAVSVELLPGGSFLLGVHIADVSHYVAEGSALDLEAYHRGTSVYFPERAVPMLPESLSNGLCSLRPSVPRLTLSAFLDIDPRGRVRRRRFARSVIRSARRLTYAEVARLLGAPQPDDESRYGAVLPVLRSAHKLMGLLHARRVERGSIDFDLPSGDVILDTDGATIGVRPSERNDAHRVVEEFMIAANEAVAEELEEREQLALYRTHGAPGRERLEELRDHLETLGIALDGDLENLPPVALQKVLAQVEGRPEEPFVSSLVLRSMQRAIYQPEPRGHYALGTQHYTHFTSPIRRYPDLLVHRQLKASLTGRTTQGQLAERLPAIATRTSFTERRAEQAERMILQWKMVRLLADRVGETFTGRITGVQPFGFFVQLDDYFVDGLVAIRTLEDDYYVYDEARHQLVGERNQRVFRLADAVEVTLTGVDRRRRGLDLRISDLAASSKPSRRRRPAGPRRRRRS
jgi:ribonuclease R